MLSKKFYIIWWWWPRNIPLVWLTEHLFNWFVLVTDSKNDQVIDKFRIERERIYPLYICQNQTFTLEDLQTIIAIEVPENLINLILAACSL